MRTTSCLQGFAVAVVLMLASASAFAGGVAPNDATPVQREEAQSHFARGHDLYTAKKLDDAAAEFDKSYSIVASPNALLFLARCDRDRGKLVTAYAELGRTAAEAKEHASEDPRYAKTAEAATEERDAITPQLGFVTVNLIGGNAETTIQIGGAKFPRTAATDAFPVMPGSSEVVVETPGKAALRQTLSVFGGEKKTVTFEAGAADSLPGSKQASASPTQVPEHVQTPEEEAAGRARLRVASYVAGAFTGIGIITFAAAGIASNNTYSNLQSECHGTCLPNSGHQGEINQGSTEQTVANVGLVVGLVSATAAVTLFVMSLPTRSDKVSLTVGPTWMGVRGEF